MKSFEELVKECQEAKEKAREGILEQILKRKNFDKLLGFGSSEQCPGKTRALIVNRLIELATTIKQFDAILSLASSSDERKNLGPKILTAAQKKCGVNEKNYSRMMRMERIIDYWLGYNR